MRWNFEMLKIELPHVEQLTRFPFLRDRIMSVLHNTFPSECSVTLWHMLFNRNQGCTVRWEGNQGSLCLFNCHRVSLWPLMNNIALKWNWIQNIQLQCIQVSRVQGRPFTGQQMGLYYMFKKNESLICYFNWSNDNLNRSLCWTGPLVCRGVLRW